VRHNPHVGLATRRRIGDGWISPIAHVAQLLAPEAVAAAGHLGAIVGIKPIANTREGVFPFLGSVLGGPLSGPGRNSGSHTGAGLKRRPSLRSCSDKGLPVAPELTVRKKAGAVSELVAILG